MSSYIFEAPYVNRSPPESDLLIQKQRTCGCFRRPHGLEPTFSALLRLERLIDDRDLRSVYMNPCLAAGESPSAVSGERCWFERGVMIYMTYSVRDKVVNIVRWEPFKECWNTVGVQRPSGEPLFGHRINYKS